MGKYEVRDIFLGFNDGLVELVGAVSGFYAAFADARSVVMAGLTVAVAGALSMAAGVFVAVGSAVEVAQVEDGRDRGLGAPRRSALIVGVAYFLGALVPLAPVLLGARSVWASILAAAVFIVILSFGLSKRYGMAPGRRVATNLAVMAATIAVTYSIGLLAKKFFGVAA